jgi:hypothetical protein
MHEADHLLWARRVVPAVLMAFGLGACSYLPAVSDVKLLPDTRTFIPTNPNEFNKASINTMRPVTQQDLVDGQGLCPGMAMVDGVPVAGAADVPVPRGVALDMTECEVVNALGRPQATDLSTNERGERNVILTYGASERPGVYQFVGGRLVSIERGADTPEPPPPAAAAKKPAPKRQAKKPPAT